MSQKIPPLPPRLHRSPLPDLQQPVRKQHRPEATKTASAQSKALQQTEYLRLSLQKLAAGQEYEDDQSFKAFTKLSRTLERTFAAASKMERGMGENELRQGGFRRIDTSLRKLLKGLGMPVQQAKYLSRGISAAIAAEETKLIHISVPGGGTINTLRHQPSGARTSGSSAARSNNSFELATIVTPPLDTAISLDSGDFSLRHNRPAPDRSSRHPSGPPTTAAQASDPELEQTPTAAAQAESAPAVSRDDALKQISQRLKQVETKWILPATNNEQTDEAAEALFSTAVGSLQQLIERLAQLGTAGQGSFAAKVQISSLRMERQVDLGGDTLRFTIVARAPIGLTAIDEQGRSTTIYPRVNGSLGKISEQPLKVTV